MRGQPSLFSALSNGVDQVSGTRLGDGDLGGLRSRPVATDLVQRAEAFLAAGPATSVELVGNVCSMTALPGGVADHMAMTLLGQYPRFSRDDAGRWRVSEARATYAVAEGIPEPLLRDLSFAVVDLETTGGRAYSGDRITEIGIVIVRNGAVERVFETLVNPERPIPPFISRLTRITWGMVAAKAPFRDICHDIHAQLEGHVFVAHNAGFDWRFLNAELLRASGRELCGRRLCTVRLARRLLPQLRSRSLDWVAGHYSVEIAPEDRHRALGDAMATARCLIRLLDDARSLGCDTWSELDHFLTVRAAASRKRRRKRRNAMPHPVERDTTA